jgi:hypothetical protein
LLEPEPLLELLLGPDDDFFELDNAEGAGEADAGFEPGGCLLIRPGTGYRASSTMKRRHHRQYTRAASRCRPWSASL